VTGEIEADAGARPAGRSVRSTALALVKVTRPWQWPKNLLVLAAPVAAGRLLEPTVWWRAGLAMAAFTAVSGAVYIFNDLRDAAADRLHPTKRLRPIASGRLGLPAAVALMVVLAAGLPLGWWLAPPLGWVLAAYLAVNLAYSLGLKHRPVIDLALVSSGFLLRAIAGGVSCDITLSQWFLLVAGFGSLFIVAGKRYSELVTVGSQAGTRPALAAYTPGFLRVVWVMAASLVIVSYSLWAFEQGRPETGLPWDALSIAPFTVAILGYARLIESGRADAPERALARDPVFLAMATIWLACVLTAVATR
jgi:decaprenyl-phosphate phosphoribosyltransferase